MTWLHISETYKNTAEVLALCCGGGWAAYRWFYEIRANTPALDGDLAIETNDISNTLDVVTVCALWNNRCKFALNLNNKKCAVSVYKIGENSPLGSLIKEEYGAPLHIQQIFPDILEPKTASTLKAHFILQKGLVYLFRWELTSSPISKWYSSEAKEYSWAKEIIWKSPLKTVPQKQN